MILEAKKLQRLTRNRIERMLGVDGTIYKAYDDDREPADLEIVRKLIEVLGIRQEWWDKDWESGNKDIFITPVDKQAQSPQLPEREFDDLEASMEALIAELRDTNRHLKEMNLKLTDSNEALRRDLSRATDGVIQLGLAAHATNDKKK